MRWFGESKQKATFVLFSILIHSHEQFLYVEEKFHDKKDSSFGTFPETSDNLTSHQIIILDQDF